MQPFSLHTMNIIARFLQPLSQSTIHLGRWNILNHNKTILKVKYATEDNCFMTYHSYTNTITNTNKQSLNSEEKSEINYIHMMGYESVHD